MDKFKVLALAGVAAAAIGMSAANAAPSLQYEMIVNGTPIIFGSGTISSSGTVTAAGAFGPFSALNLSASGVPVVTSPRLSTTANISTSATGSGTNTIEVILVQTGLTSPTGSFNFQNTIDLSNLGGTVSSSVRDYIDPNNGGFNAAGTVATGENILVGSLTGVAGQDTTNGALGSILTVNVGPGAYSETQDLIATFRQASDSLALGDQFLTTSLPPTTVPEPASLALIGTALFGFGLIRRRNRS